MCKLTMFGSAEEHSTALSFSRLNLFHLYFTIYVPYYISCDFVIWRTHRHLGYEKTPQPVKCWFFLPSVRKVNKIFWSEPWSCTNCLWIYQMSPEMWVTISVSTIPFKLSLAQYGNCSVPSGLVNMQHHESTKHFRQALCFIEPLQIKWSSCK